MKREEEGDIGVILERETTRVSSARRSVLLMRAECLANRVALVRTRSINEIKTNPREQRSFRSIASLQPVGWSIGRSVERSVQRDGSTVGSSRKSTRCRRPLCHTIISSFIYIYAFIRIFRQSIAVRECAINARNNSHKRQEREDRRRERVEEYLWYKLYVGKDIAGRSLIINYVLREQRFVLRSISIDYLEFRAKWQMRIDASDNKKKYCV